MVRIPTLILLVAAALVVASCGPTEPVSIVDTTAALTTTSTPEPTTQAPSSVPPSPPAASSTTQAPPPTVEPDEPVTITPGFWPDDVRRLLVADGDRLTRVMRNWSSKVATGPYLVAFEDGRSGLAFVTADLKDGHVLPTAYWQPVDGLPAFVGRPSELEFLGALHLPQLWPGPLFATYRYDTNNVPGDTCIGYVPLKSLDGSFISMEGTLTCRRAPERLEASAWSGRYFVLAVSGDAGSRLEFDTPDGHTLEFTGAPAATNDEIRLVAAAPGTNLVAYTVASGPPASSVTRLVVHDLGTGSELLRIAVANPGTAVAMLDMTASTVVVSLRDVGASSATDRHAIWTGGRPLPALLVDIATGTVGEVPVAGVATIDPRPEPPPALLPPRSDPSSPDIVVAEPQDHVIASDEVMRFAGLTEPGNTVVAGGRYDVPVSADGRWSIALTLRPGSNVATFAATSPDGVVAETSVAVAYVSDWVGLVHQVGLPYAAEPTGDHLRVFDVWNSPASAVDAWAYVALGGEWGTAGGWEVRGVSIEPPPAEDWLPVEMVWLARVAYVDRGVITHWVADVARLAHDGWLGPCNPDTVVLLGRDGTYLEAWRVSDDRTRLLQVDIEGLVCEPMAAG